MLTNPDHLTARQLLLAAVSPVEGERVPLHRSGGRLLAAELLAAENIPPFDRSPYDGYAVRAADTAAAARETPVTLRILEEVPAGAVPTQTVTAGTATKVLTGAPIPPGADAVVKYEDTGFTAETVTLFAPLKQGESIVRAGEDVRQGELLARRGQRVDPGVAGTLAAQGIAEPLVYRMPTVGILSTGSELVEAETVPGPGKIRNSNRYTFETVLTGLGCRTVYLGTAGDDVNEIARLLEAGLDTCDAVLTTGGVSVGDYDLTPAAMELAGVELLFRGVDMKPGMACAYGVRQDKLVLGLSGNPASALTNFYAVALPALRKLLGHETPVPPMLRLTLSQGFPKKSPKTRFLRGRLDLTGSDIHMTLPRDQGNIVLSSAIGCDAMAIVPAGSGSVPAGTVLEGFLL